MCRAEDHGDTRQPLTPNPSRATVSADCITAYNDLKLNKKYKYVIFKLADDNKEIVVESTSEDGPEYDDFRDKLINAQSKSRTVCCNALLTSWSVSGDGS